MKKDSRRSLHYLTAAGVFAALITVMTAYLFHIPTGVNGGYIHFGDMLIYLCASLLPTPYAVCAAAIGGGLADLLTAPMWAPATVLIKALVALPFSAKQSKIVCRRNVVAAVIALFITIIGYYFAERLIFGGTVAFIASATGNLVQSTVSMALFLAFGTVLDRMHIRARIEDRFLSE